MRAAQVCFVKVVLNDQSPKTSGKADPRYSIEHISQSSTIVDASSRASNAESVCIKAE